MVFNPFMVPPGMEANVYINQVVDVLADAHNRSDSVLDFLDNDADGDGQADDEDVLAGLNPPTGGDGAPVVLRRPSRFPIRRSL